MSLYDVYLPHSLPMDSRSLFVVRLLRPLLGVCWAVQPRLTFLAQPMRTFLL